MLIDRTSLPRHIPWIIFTVIVTTLSSIWYFGYAARSGMRPSGSSPPGLTFGILGGAIILFDFFLWPRKKLRTWRIGRAELWLRAHIWLGLCSVPLVLYHTGFRLGGNLSSNLMMLFLVVIASGIVGLVLQQFLPFRMFQSVPAETIYSQIDHVLVQLRAEADRLVRAICGAPAKDETVAIRQEQAVASASDTLSVGALGQVGRIQGRVLQTVVPGAPPPGAELLHTFYRQTIEPFLRLGAAAKSPLRSAKQAELMFRDLRSKLDPAAHQAVGILEGLCEQRRQFDEQARMHFWLHSWLWIHLPLSVALVLLLMVHIWVAMKYW